MIQFSPTNPKNFLKTSLAPKHTNLRRSALRTKHDFLVNIFKNQPPPLEEILDLPLVSGKSNYKRWFRNFCENFKNESKQMRIMFLKILRSSIFFSGTHLSLKDPTIAFLSLSAFLYFSNIRIHSAQFHNSVN